MPNHITNGVSIKHEDISKMRELVEKTKVEDGQFDFNGIIPQPEGIETDGCSGKHEPGVICWYEWNVENWGTKWGAYDFELKGTKDNELHIEFNTAWRPPTPIFEKLVEMGYEVSAVSIDEGGGEPMIFGDPDNFYAETTLGFYM